MADQRLILARLPEPLERAALAWSPGSISGDRLAVRDVEIDLSRPFRAELHRADDGVLMRVEQTTSATERARIECWAAGGPDLDALRDILPTERKRGGLAFFLEPDELWQLIAALRIPLAANGEERWTPPTVSTGDVLDAAWPPLRIIDDPGLPHVVIESSPDRLRVDCRPDATSGELQQVVDPRREEPPARVAYIVGGALVGFAGGVVIGLAAAGLLALVCGFVGFMYWEISVSPRMRAYIRATTCHGPDRLEFDASPARAIFSDGTEVLRESIGFRLPGDTSNPGPWFADRGGRRVCVSVPLSDEQSNVAFVLLAEAWGLASVPEAVPTGTAEDLSARSDDVPDWVPPIDDLDIPVRVFDKAVHIAGVCFSLDGNTVYAPETRELDVGVVMDVDDLKPLHVRYGRPTLTGPAHRKQVGETFVLRDARAEWTIGHPASGRAIQDLHVALRRIASHPVVSAG